MQSDEQNQQDQSHSSGISLAFIILGLHVVLLLGVGAAVVLIKGIYDLRWALFALAAALIGLSAYVFYQRFKADRQQVSRMMRDPSLAGRDVEISLLGGMASVKMGQRDESPLLLDATGPKPLLQIDELSKLKQMLDEGLLEFDEFQQLKREVLDQTRMSRALPQPPDSQPEEVVLPSSAVSSALPLEPLAELDEQKKAGQSDR